jgi:hypothetical protein
MKSKFKVSSYKFSERTEDWRLQTSGYKPETENKKK